MLRCGYCDKICDSYEDWLSHLVSQEHQANLGVNDVFVKHNKDHDRNERSIIMHKMNPKSDPYEVVCHFACIEPLAFITDAYRHIFPHVNEKFYLIVFDNRKFAQRITTIHEKCGDQKVITSMVDCKRKSALTESDWNEKLETSFFYRRHEHLKRKLNDMNWDEQLENLLKFICLDQTGYQQRETVMEELETLIREEYLEATVNPFGSCTTWLADVNADLDVYVDALGDKGRYELKSPVKMEIMDKITKILREKYGGKNVFPVKNARVPIVKLTHPSGLKIDISFENCLSVQNSKMIRLMTKLDYRVRRLLIFLRYWGRFHNLIGPHSVKSYALIMMAFVYLRREKLLPSVYELQHIEGVNEFTVCDWNASYCGSREVTFKHLPWLKGCREQPSSEGLGHEVMKLAYGFFKEYATFDFDTQVICPATGSFLPKSSFESTNGVELPIEMGLLKANLATSLCSIFPTKKPLCIQDPFALNVNVTASCGNADIVNQLKAACSRSAEALHPFIRSYGLAGTENFLELCCQTPSEVKKPEVSTSDGNDTNNHDLLAYVKTEATSSTHENEWDVGDNATADAIAEAVQRDEYAERSYKFDKDREQRTDERYDTRQRSRDSEPSRIQRTSMYDDSRERGRSYDQDRYSRLDQSLPLGENYYSNSSRDEDERKRRALKSSVIVAGKSNNVKSEVTSSLSPSSSSSREKSSTSRASVGAASSSSIREGNNEHNKSNKNLKEIVVVVERKSQTREVMDFQSASVSSAPVLYGQNQTVKFVQEKPAKPPVVKFVPTETPFVMPNFSIPPPSLVPPTPPPPPPPPPPASAKVEPPEEDEYCEEEDEEDVVTEHEEVLKFLHSLNQIAPPDDSTVNFDTYGYDRAVQPKQVQNVKPPAPRAVGHYVPPQARNSSGVQPPPLMSAKPMLCFPAFSLFMNDTYQQQFMSIVSNIVSVSEAARTLKMRILWVNSIFDFFSESNFWAKFSPLYPASSYECNRLQETEVVFEMAAKKQVEFLEKDAHQYCYINSKRKREMVNEPVGMFGPQTKMLKPNPETTPANSLMEYHQKAEIMSKLSKIPPNARKPYAIAYYFACRPEIMESLYNRWQTVSSSLIITQSPLEVFGKLCHTVATKSSVTPVPASPNEFILPVRLLVAVDTHGAIPGVYFGFETSIPPKHPNWKKQEVFNSRFEKVLKDLINAYLNHRLHKYFK